MEWPLYAQYQEAVQNPAHCFNDHELKNGTVDKSSDGIPLVWAGGFSAVFRVTCGGVRYAIKCFIRDDDFRAERYRAISSFVSSENKLDCWVKIQYLDRGIKVDDYWYPLLKMEWVDGVPLHKYIEAQLHEPDVLTSLAESIRLLSRRLLDMNIAHGDLQHGNILVTGDGIQLVDYDGMFLKELNMYGSNELGFRNYAHPFRKKSDYGNYLDNFPAFIIYLSLVALADNPSLWEFHTEDNLILTYNDFVQPLDSACISRLQSSKEPKVRQYADYLVKLCSALVKDIPSLDSIIEGVIPEPSKEVLEKPVLISTGVTLLSPVGGENWKPDTSHLIQWNCQNFDGDIKIDLVWRTHSATVVAMPASLNSFLWTIPKFQREGNKYKIAIRYAHSNEVACISTEFTIVSDVMLRRLSLFSKVPCSWCERFYTTQPWLCFHKHIDPANCFLIKNRRLNRLTESEHACYLNDDRWWWAIKEETGILESKW
jgi:hypothetical protein